MMVIEEELASGAGINQVSSKCWPEEEVTQPVCVNYWEIRELTIDSQVSS